MSYCVHCGVELAQSERDCPLCHTLVQNPHCDWEKPEILPYPETVDVLDAHIDRSYARSLVTVIFAVIGFVTFGLDLLSGGGLTWSPYVVGSMGLIYAFIVVPILFKFPRPYAYLTIDFLSLAAFLLMTAILTDGLSWYIGLFIPLFVLSILVLLGIVLALRRREWPWLYRIAAACLLVGLFLLGLEGITRIYREMPLFFKWSFYATIPTTVLAIMLVIAERNKKIKNEIKKRLFI